MHNYLNLKVNRKMGNSFRKLDILDIEQHYQSHMKQRYRKKFKTLQGGVACPVEEHDVCYSTCPGERNTLYIAKVSTIST